MGRACPLCPGTSYIRHQHTSDINLFRYCQSIIYFDAEISGRAFDLSVAKQKLDSPRLWRAGGHDCLDRFGQAFHVPICQPPPQVANHNANAIERDHSLRVYLKISMRESKTERTPPT